MASKTFSINNLVIIRAATNIQFVGYFGIRIVKSIFSIRLLVYYEM